MNEYATSSKWKYLLNILFWIALGGGLVWLYLTASTQTPAKPIGKPLPTSEQRKQAVSDVVNAGPQTKLWSTPHGEVIELSIPSASIGGRFVEYKRCIVWRDPITATSAISCPGPAVEDRDLYPSDGPDYSDLR